MIRIEIIAKIFTAIAAAAQIKYTTSVTEPEIIEKMIDKGVMISEE